jgi:hypothetical protein
MDLLRYGSFNDTVRNSDYTASNDRTTVSNTLKRIWKGGIVAEFEALARHLPGMTAESSLAEKLFLNHILPYKILPDL